MAGAIEQQPPREKKDAAIKNKTISSENRGFFDEKSEKLYNMIVKIGNIIGLADFSSAVLPSMATKCSKKYSAFPFYGFTSYKTGIIAHRG